MKVRVVAHMPHTELVNSAPGQEVEVSDALAVVWFKNNWAVPIKQSAPRKIPSSVDIAITHQVQPPAEEAPVDEGAQLMVDEGDDEDDQDEEEEKKTEDQSLEFAVIPGAPERAVSRRGRKRKRRTWQHDL